MAQLNVKLPEERLEALRQLADRRRTPVSWLIKDYVDYLLAGGQPVTPATEDEIGGRQLAALAERGGSFDWLAEEPELYSDADGEPMSQGRRRLLASAAHGGR
jgi:hypothetical protein